MPAYQYGQLPYPVSDVDPRYPSVNYGVSPNHYQGYGQTDCHPSQLSDSTVVAYPYMEYNPVFDKYNPMFDSSNHYNGAMNLPMPVGAPLLPPLRIDERYMGNYPQNYGHGHSDGNQAQSQVKEEKPVGGVSAKLDYDMEQMTDFVSEMTVGMYDILKYRICIADIDLTRSIKPTSTVSPSFRKWVLGVLNATRLPSATVLLSLSYLTLRVRGLFATGRFAPQDRSLYQMLTVGLILGSKFLDDNTFQNKSWAEVSNIPVVELNTEERDWLGAFNHRLHHDANAPDGFVCWEEKWKTFKTRAATVSAAAADATIARQRSLRPTATPTTYQQQAFGRNAHPILPYPVDMTGGSYSSPSYSPYGGWTGYESSPSTAPHTGPNTPDFYVAQSGWGSFDHYGSRHAQSGFPSLPQPKPQVHAHNMAYPTSHYNLPNTTMWNCHSSACQCSGCRNQAQFFQPRYGQILVG